MRMQKCTLKHFSNFAENRGLARAWLSPLERTCRQRGFARAWLTSLERAANSRKVLVARFSRSMDAQPMIERETQTLARAQITSLERTANHMNFWAYAFHARAWLSTLERKCMYSECTLEREALRSSVDPKFGIFRLILKHKIQLLKL